MYAIRSYYGLGQRLGQPHLDLFGGHVGADEGPGQHPLGFFRCGICIGPDPGHGLCHIHAPRVNGNLGGAPCDARIAGLRREARNNFV